jgi:hypothetical protein
MGTATSESPRQQWHNGPIFSSALFGGFIMRTLLIRLGILLGMVTATATVTVIGPATAIAGAGLGVNHNEVMASG